MDTLEDKIDQFHHLFSHVPFSKRSLQVSTITSTEEKQECHHVGSFNYSSLSESVQKEIEKNFNSIATDFETLVGNIEDDDINLLTTDEFLDMNGGVVTYEYLSADFSKMPLFMKLYQEKCNGVNGNMHVVDVECPRPTYIVPKFLTKFPMCVKNCTNVDDVEAVIAASTFDYGIKWTGQQMIGECNYEIDKVTGPLDFIHAHADPSIMIGLSLLIGAMIGSILLIFAALYVKGRLSKDASPINAQEENIESSNHEEVDPEQKMQ